MDHVLHVLQTIDTFKEVPEEQLQWLIGQSTLNEYKVGDRLFQKGNPMDHLHILLRGKFVMKIEQNNQYKAVGYFGEKDITGTLPYSRASIASGLAEAVQDASILSLHKKYFKEMIHDHHELTTALVHHMSSRIRHFTKLQQQDDKMRALGKLSAGLAHELNNPSSAVVRSASELKKHLALLPGGFKQVIQIKVKEEDVDQINEILFSKIQQSSSQEMSMLEKSSLEDDIMDWMDENGLDAQDEIAEVLADFNFQIDDLDIVKEHLREEDLLPVLHWFSQVLITEKLVNEIEEASQRIGNLVSSVKSYTHMDQAPEKKPFDIHIGIRNTMNMLNHRIKKGQIDIVENFEASLPHPKVFVSELNQVWTNLIDNAIDAMENTTKKELEIETLRDGEFVNINIKDSGKGIPEEELDQIFDPFFTTKEIGKGTGLGLEVVQQIIEQHNGMITVKSKPGETVFNICIPIE